MTQWTKAQLEWRPWRPDDDGDPLAAIDATIVRARSGDLAAVSSLLATSRPEPKAELITRKASTAIVRKTYAIKGISDNPMDFILSDATPDRYDDTIDPNGWDLTNFRKNPIALFNHNSDFPIGHWENLGVKDKALRGHLHMAPAASSPRIAELHALINAGVLRSVSVGFVARESRPRSEGHGVHYVRQELVETSLVSVPANPNAVMTAKNLRVSPETLTMVFDSDEQRDAEWKARRAEVYKDLRPASVGYVECELDRLDKSISKDIEEMNNRIVTDTQKAIDSLGHELDKVYRELDQMRQVRGEMNAILEFLGKKPNAPGK